MTESELTDLVARTGDPYGDENESTRDVSRICVLTLDVTNPRPDRRSKEWINRPTWEYATRFHVVVRLHKSDGSVDRLMGCYRVGARFALTDWSDLDRDQRRAIITSLSPATETLAERFERVSGFYASDVTHERDFLVWSVDSGQLGHAHAEEMLKALIRSES